MKVTTSDNFHAGFNTLSFSQPMSVFAADQGQTPIRQAVQRLNIAVQLNIAVRLNIAVQINVAVLYN